MTCSSPMNVDRLQAALALLLSPTTFSVHIPFDNSDESSNGDTSNNFLTAYVHTCDASTKGTLLAKQITIAAKPSPSTQPPPSPGIQSKPAPTQPKPPSAESKPPAAQLIPTTVHIDGVGASRSKHFTISLSKDEMTEKSTASDVRQALVSASGYGYLFLSSSYLLLLPSFTMLIEKQEARVRQMDHSFRL